MTTDERDAGQAVGTYLNPAVVSSAGLLAAAGGSGGVSGTGSSPSAPQEIAASGGNGEITLTWSAVPGALTYTIYWSTSPGVTAANGTPIVSVTSLYVHHGVTNGQAYYYAVVAV